MSVTLQDSAPDLADAYAVPQSAIDSFRKNGHVLLREVVNPDDVAFYRRAIGKAVERHNTEKRSLAERDTYGKAFLQIMNLWTKDETVRKFSLAKRFGRIAADLLGVDAVRMYLDQALYKEAGGGHTPWHQDQFYWPLDTPNTVTLWMPLVDATQEMGTMTFASGTHAGGAKKLVEISDESEAYFNKLIVEEGFPLSKAGDMKAGDATFHYGWTLHGAPGNKSGLTREVMTVIYYADGARVIKPKNSAQEEDIKFCFPGLAPGDLAAADLNPIIFKR